MVEKFIEIFIENFNILIILIIDNLVYVKSVGRFYWVYLWFIRWYWIGVSDGIGIEVNWLCWVWMFDCEWFIKYLVVWNDII